MQKNHDDDLWRYEIIIGKYPAKTTQFRERKYRKDIIEFFVKINKVVYICDWEERALIQRRLYSRVDIIEQIYNAVNREYNQKRKKKKLDIVLCKAQKLQFTISSSERFRYVMVNIPICDLTEDW